ncbi:MAG: helix-turn-helix transcriptional regulator, partial [Lachnospiraceae bacterium]|nr:helix-turn-helix transcriptional regulator [Lachnospiraceae bacterium]
RYAEFEELCIRHLKTIALSGYAEPEALKAYVNNLFQTLLSFLQNRNILFDYIFRGAPFTILHENSPKSIYDATLFIRYVIRISSRYIEEMGSGQSVADTICRFIEQNYAKEISRNSLTEMFHFDPDYASRIFKKETGRSFKQYLIDKRIEEAKKLLLNSDLPISTVSDRVGYENYSYFTRLFKKETGMTPVDFRSQGKVH